MPRNGSGTFVPLNNSWYPPVNGVLATAADFQAQWDDVVAGLTQSVSADGQTTMTGNLPMGGNTLTSLGAPTGNGMPLRWEQLVKGADIASAATINIPNEGQIFSVTGTTGISAFSGSFPGRFVFLQFAGILTMTNSASLALPNGQNITTAANEVYGFLNTAPGIWTCILYPQKAFKGRFLGVQIFTSSGTYDPGTYNGVTATMVRKRICGGGGGGGGCQATSSTQVAVAGGGNGGAYIEWIGPAVSETVTIGAGGPGGAPGFNSGTSGGATSAGNLIAGGGVGGIGGGAGSPPFLALPQSNSGGGALGPADGGTIIVNRGNSLGSYGIALTLTSAIPGYGGDSPFSPNYRGGIAPPSNQYGAGGSGGNAGVSSVATAGRSGAQGVVIYEEYA